MLHRSLTALLLVAAFTLTAPYGHAQSARRAAMLTSVSPAHCVDALERREAPDPLRCPTALRAAVVEAAAVCRDAGGTLEGVTEGHVWAIDVNDDDRSELAFELNGNVSCAGAWSVFSCGSLGCPKSLYELRDGDWAVVGSLYATAPEHVSLGARGADGHRALEVCSDDDCTERSTYEWGGAGYDATGLEVRGTRVDIANSVHGLHALATEVTVRASPNPRSDDVGRYDAGTEVAIIGTVEGGSHYYVSPCNACASGFVPRTAVAVP